MKDKIILKLNEKSHNCKELIKALHIKSEKEKAKFYSALDKLKYEGLIKQDENGYYKRIKFNKNPLKGYIEITKVGNGIVLDNKSEQKKYLVKSENLNGALNGDKVIIRPVRRSTNGFIEAKVEKIIERVSNKAIFEYDGNDFIPYNIYGNIKIICPKENLKGLVSGSLVLVELKNKLEATFEDKNIFKGEVKQIVGHKDDPDIDEKAIGARHGFFVDFPEEVMEELKHIPDKVSEEEIKGRVDLRDETIFTIDGSNTKDMDDAISINTDKQGNFILKVHIADVNYYVKENSALDLEARRRGTSAYLADSVLPMLPHQLSNGICSLNENEDRLTKTVEMLINPKGEVIDYKIYNSVIRSRKKMTYENVQLILDDKSIPEGYEDFELDLICMDLLSNILSEKRDERGNIDFASRDLTITKENGVTKFEEKKQTSSERLIENFMVLANEVVTKHYAMKNLPFVYRVHEDPHSDRLVDVLNLLQGQKLVGKEVSYLLSKIKKGTFTSKDINNFLSKYKNSDLYELISVAILATMSKARYSNENAGHYGLALDYYTHFTSPIRRYPDLIVHRLIDKYNNNLDLNQLENIERSLPEICEQSSYMEREADEAEKETGELMMVHFALDHIGQSYRGKITAFNSDSMTVKLDNNVKGIVQNNLNPKLKRKKQYHIGQTVYAVIKEVSVPHRVIYFGLESKEKKQRKKLIKK